MEFEKEGVCPWAIAKSHTVVIRTAWIIVAHGRVDTEDPHAASPERGVHNGHVNHQILHPI
jgi:hypothetical protein